MIVLRYTLGLVAAVGVYVLALWLNPQAGRFFDPFLVLVLHHAIRSSPVSSALGASVAGLAHDALTGGLFGLHGFANTLAAYVATSLRQRFVVQRPLQVALLCLVGAAVQVTTLTLLQFVMLANADLPKSTDSLLSALISCVLCTIVYLLSGRFFSWERRVREQRRQRLRLDT